VNKVFSACARNISILVFLALTLLEPSDGPSGSFYPSFIPSSPPTESGVPSSFPSDKPSSVPSLKPSLSPSAVPVHYSEKCKCINEEIRNRVRENSHAQGRPIINRIFSRSVKAEKSESELYAHTR
jgi:hypothetical protein